MLTRYKTFSDAGINVPFGATGEVYTTCPECSPQRKKKSVKCLSANVEKEIWLCHHCGFRGKLNDYAERGEFKHWHKAAYRRPERVPATTIQATATEWLRERCISSQTASRNRLWTGRVYMPQVEAEVGAIAFPYYRDGELVNIKWRSREKHFRLEAGAERILYGLDDIKSAAHVIWVEGEMDKLSVEEAGYINCVSVPNGAPAVNAKDYAAHFSYLESAQPWLEGKKHIIAVDNDEAGRKLAEELTRRLGIEQCSRVEWPEGCKDANDCLQMYGAEWLKKFIDDAQPYPIDGVFTAIDVEDKIQRLYLDGVERGVTTGWPSLDENFLVRPGEFTVVTGIPNSGKSNFIDALAVNLAKNHGWSFAVFSPENQPIEDHVSRIAEKYIGKPFSRGINERMSQQELSAANEWISDHFFWILPDDDTDWSIDQILKRAQALVYQHGIRGLIVDPWNELEHAAGDESETMYISKALKRIRQFGRRHGLHIFVVVHPAKLQKQPNGNYPVPTLYDCAGSAHWRNKADNGLVVWRDFSDPRSIEVEIHIQKIRFRQNGKLGMTPLSYNRVTATYHEQSRAIHEIPPIYP
jgi:twinkle protein